MSKSRVGIWLIGAKGGVASTAIVGLIALKQRLIEPVGLVSQLPQFARLDLTDWSDLVVAGHEIRAAALSGEAMRLATESRTTTAGVIEACRPAIDEIERRIRPGTIYNVGSTIAALADMELPGNETPRAIVDRLGRDMTEFARSEQLAHVVVVNVASTEPRVDAALLPPTWPELERMLDAPGPCPLPASSLYAVAALHAGYSYLNFTPSLGSAPAAIHHLAVLRGTRHYGCDGKTGETLMKSVLAPMFARRNLHVMSWVGHNIFGNMDGQVLDDPANKQAKVASKDHLLGDILGYRPKTLVSIEFIPDLGDWKTAWDHIHFAGFLGAPMTLQFIWQGCDSALAAPLVLDLVRFTTAAWRRGEVGAMDFLASFFKSPYGAKEHSFERQFQALEQWAANGRG